MAEVLQLSLTNLNELDGGKAAMAFDQHLRRAALDCMDRPGDETPRKIVMEITVQPVTDEKGDCTDVWVQFKASSALPKHQTRPYSMGLRRNGVLVFNCDSPDNINQSTFDMGERDRD